MFIHDPPILDFRFSILNSQSCLTTNHCPLPPPLRPSALELRTSKITSAFALRTSHFTYLSTSAITLSILFIISVNGSAVVISIPAFCRSAIG
jgi:hypothetical protein